MSESESQTDVAQSLKSEPYGDLMNLARSMNEQFGSVNIDTDAPTKENELVPALAEYEPEGNRSEGWTVEVDGSREEVDLLKVQTPDKNSGSSSGPIDKTVLYCLTRSATTEERIEMIAESLESTPLEIEASASGDKYSIILPAEEQDGYVEPEGEDDEDESEEPNLTKVFTIGEEMAEDAIEELFSNAATDLGADDYEVESTESAGENEVRYTVNFFGADESEAEGEESDEESDSAESAENAAESGEDSEQGESSESEESAESEAAEADESEESEEGEPEDEESEDEEAEESGEDEGSEGEEDEDEEDEGEDEEVVSADAYRVALEQKTKDEIYDLAIEYDVPDRSNMSKDELIDGVIEANPDVE